MKTFSTLLYTLGTTGLLLFLTTLSSAQKQTNTHQLHNHHHETDATVESAPEFHDEIDDASRAAIQRQLNSNIEYFINEGILPSSPNREAVVSLAWPLRLKTGLTDPGYYVVGQHVDHNPAYPNQLLDYNCGNRTYDTNTGNHKGTDIGIWPFSFLKMDSSHVQVVAAAAGTIISKTDGNFDRNSSCSIANNNWNAVYIRHADGSIAWYGHLKNGSVTTKDSGQTVTQGEYLGVVGSSGNSTGPHLHFELYNAAGQLVDPYSGPCNNSGTWWANQEPYNKTTVNKIMTCFKAPESNCSTTERPNESRSFCIGDSIYMAVFIRNSQVGHIIKRRLLKPDNTIQWERNDTITVNYPGYAHYRWIRLGTGVPTGTWKYQVIHQGVTHQSTFTLNTATVPSITITPSPNTGACSGLSVTFSSNPVNPGANPAYRWQVNGVNAGTGATFTTSSLVSGNTVRCILTSSSVCASPKTATSNTITMTSGVPPTPGTISGAASGVCNSTRQYSIAKIANAASYTWTVPSGVTILSGQGTLMIKVRFSSTFSSGNIGVRAINVCGTSSTKTLAVVGAPGLPGTISGAASVCKGQLNAAYSVAAVSGATSYTWTVPSGSSIVSGQGTRSIVVNFGTSTGNVSVRASNGCGLSSTRSLAITMPCRVSDDGLETETPLEANVFPNPSRDQFTLNTNAGVDEKYNIQVVDMLGKTVEMHNGLTSDGQITFGSDYAPGVYIVSILQGKRKAFVRIIKQ